MNQDRIVNIVAHEDDDLLFINPLIQNDIDNGSTVATIYITAGDGSREPGYWQSREAGMGAAYAEMTSATVSAPEEVAVLDRTITRYSINDHPEISLCFLRLTDPAEGDVNYEGLKNLWEGSIESLITMDGSPAYTKQQLIDVLHELIAEYQPTIIRALDYMTAFGGDDHITHTAAANFGRATHINYTVPHQFIGYKGYGTEGMPVNVNGQALIQKQNAYFAYDPYDWGKNCSSVGTCSDINLIEWTKRNYSCGDENRVLTDFDVMEGDSNSLSHNDGDIGVNSTAIEFMNTLYVFYYDSSSKCLRYAITSSPTNPQWTFKVLDSTGSVGQNPTAAIYNSTLHLFYADSNNGILRHARTADGTTWEFENLDGDAAAISLQPGSVGSAPTAVVANGVLEVFYYDEGLGNLRHAWLNGSSWQFENLDGSSDPTGSTDTGLNPTAVVNNGVLEVFYYDNTNGVLRHAWSDSTGWQFENLDGDAVQDDGRIAAKLGQNPSAIVQNTTLHVFYHDQTNFKLRHAWSNGTGWQFENLEGDTDSATRQSGDVGATPFAVIQGTFLHVLACDLGDNSLRHYWASPSQGWQVERLDGQGDDGPTGRIECAISNPSAVVYGTYLHGFYYDSTNGNLRHASMSPAGS